MGPLHRPICPIYECDLILLLAFYYTTTAPERHHFQDNEQQRDNRMAQSLHPQNCLEELQCIMTWTGATHGPLHIYAWENTSMSMLTVCQVPQKCHNSKVWATPILLVFSLFGPVLLLY